MSGSTATGGWFTLGLAAGFSCDIKTQVFTAIAVMLGDNSALYAACIV